MKRLDRLSILGGRATWSPLGYDIIGYACCKGSIENVPDCVMVNSLIIVDVMVFDDPKVLLALTLTR